MSGPWSTVWQIAAQRAQTMAGEDFLSDHAVEVLQAFAIKEQTDAMKDALGGVYGRLAL